MLLSSGRNIIKHVLYCCVNKLFFREHGSLDSVRCKLVHMMKMKRIIIKLACAEEKMTVIFLEEGIKKGRSFPELNIKDSYTVLSQQTSIIEFLVFGLSNWKA